jgi:hypothetical protein
MGIDIQGRNPGEASREAFFKRMGGLYSRGSLNFVPLVLEELCLRVSLDILFLRPDRHPLIKEGGDIDNRLKTLFDALRLPDSNAGLGGPSTPDEDPFFVLLKDDCLISDVRITTDNLLLLPNNRALDPKEAFLVIDVKLQPMERTPKSWAFE